MARINIEKLLLEVDIEKVAERLGMTLKPESGNRKLAICPFHDDKTPSLLIDTSRDHSVQHYHCFACGEHGDAIDLVRGVLKLDFKAAVDWLSPSYSAAVDKKNQGSYVAQAVATEGSGLEAGYKLYSSSGDIERLSEWASARKLNLSILKEAGFVYAPKNILSKRLSVTEPFSKRREISGVLEDAGLVRRLLPSVGNASYYLGLESAQDSTYVDFFIGNRVVFPVRDSSKRILGLAARATDEGSAKYLFSKGFSKAKALYRLDSAVSKVRASAKSGVTDLQLYICEGFLDALRLEGLGLPAVAVMGASISKEQVKLLRELSESLPSKKAVLTINVCFDRDEAGLRGASEAVLKLLAANLDVLFVWPTSAQIANAGLSSECAKDPDEYLTGLSNELALSLLSESTYEPGAAVLANQFCVDADELLDPLKWEGASRSRKYRAFEKAKAELIKISGGGSKSLKDLIASDKAGAKVTACLEWLSFASEDSAKKAVVSECYLTNSDARLNHARLLAYMGSRRGELPCDEPKWERLDVAATAFNFLLRERLANGLREAIGPFDAVWVPRSFGGEEPRLKVMPQPEDLTIQQYLLNEILTERWDGAALGSVAFSQNIPAVRYYREERKTVTTGLRKALDDNKPIILLDRTLSFAYQIDMEVLEGRQPATDQGMFRPFHECWRDFTRSLNKQARDIGYVHTIRLDVSRYYDRLRRHVVRDSVQSSLRDAFETVANDAQEFAGFLQSRSENIQASDRSASIVDQLSDMIFGYPYFRPDDSRIEVSSSSCGIPQGPVISAWIGSIALFPVDLAALELMDRHNVDGQIRVGYARYVDDIVLLADSESLLEELRDIVDRKVRGLELALVAKADAIPPMSATEFSDYLNKGRALEASGPAWEPPLVGDGESGWELWSGTPASDRQSALHLLSNWEIYKSSVEVILRTVKTAFLAMDLRASELAKGARLIWYVVASECLETGSCSSLTADDAWELFHKYWRECSEEADWKLDSAHFSWESPVLFALEGLEKLLDHRSSYQLGLSSLENKIRNSRISCLAKLVLSSGFRARVMQDERRLVRQIDRRLKLLEWKASKTCGENVPRTLEYEDRSMLVRAWQPFEWLHAAVERLALADRIDEADPLGSYVFPYVELENKVPSANKGSYELFGYFLPEADDLNGLLNVPRTNTDYAGLAVQVLVAILPRSKILKTLSNRSHLIGSKFAPGQFLVMPPLPGINQTRMVACEINESVSDLFGGVKAFYAYEVAQGEAQAYALKFYGGHGENVVEMSPDWIEDDCVSSLNRFSSELPDGFDLRVLARPALGRIALPGGLSAVASLYRSIVYMLSEYERQYDGLELIPAWPYIARHQGSGFFYLICEGVKKGEVGNRAFVRDGGRALRTVEVPIYEAQLWRAGVAISDYLGFYDDIAKFSSSESEVPFDDVTVTEPEKYVLRSQLRKLRGAFANSQIGRRTFESSLLPASVERALELLESFPADSEDLELQLMHVLATEAETAAMRICYEKEVSSLEVTVFLRSIVSRVLAKLPLGVGEILTACPAEKGLRRDFAGILAFSRQLWSVGKSSGSASLFAWKVLFSGFVSSGVSVALQGVITSLRSHGDFNCYEGFDFPPEWEVSPVNDIPVGSNLAASNADDTFGLLELLRQLVSHLGHRLRLGERVGNDQTEESISEHLYDQIKNVALALARLSKVVPDEVGEWPFIGVAGEVFEVLNIDLLESVRDLVKRLDAELGLQVVLVKEQSYGFNAQSRRFTDSRGRTWDIQPWMLSQFPTRFRHIEESYDDARRVLRVWSEIYDQKSERLLSVSVLGEPFASMALLKESSDKSCTSDVQSERASEAETEVSSKVLGAAKEFRDAVADKDDSIDGGTHSASGRGEVSAEDGSVEERDNIALEADSARIDDSVLGARAGEVSNSTPVSNRPERSSFSTHEFNSRQQAQWERRGRAKNPAHIRVALFQWDLELSYAHPIVEACPSRWPLSLSRKGSALKRLHESEDSIYGNLLNSTSKAGMGHLWKEENVSLPSWAEHRRRRLLMRAVNACESLGVDLLVLPEYSVRRETVEWLRKDCLPGKNVAVLAGTYLEFDPSSSKSTRSAILSLLWPVPRSISSGVGVSSIRANQDRGSVRDALDKGLVLKWERSKKYRSIGLSEFIRPGSKPLSPLFDPGAIVDSIREQCGWELSVESVVQLLAHQSLPLSHFMELICSEIFLVTSPTNIPQMAYDYASMISKFESAAKPEDYEKKIWRDLQSISKRLSVCGAARGSDSRRSILLVPAATTRTADYWIAGQAGLLAAGTTTVFSNGVGVGLKGGSCFIGRESWKTGDDAIGYIASMTPYHGWSKGIYYNSKNDPLSFDDQALVVADIDPCNMLEGKPRPQMLPVPLQLVAYLPVVETVDFRQLDRGLHKSLKLDYLGDNSEGERSDYGRLVQREAFWLAVQQLSDKLDVGSFSIFSKYFSDRKAMDERRRSYADNGTQQPFSSSIGRDLFSSPALYDWLDVDMSLRDGELLPLVSVPPWSDNNY
ncbi:CHC2 zinc finger domain-containing protein [Ectopseudomonas guguanensis]|uniref:CHC2 zinc finger domain-containing protein n=1 Tax=Ectopseudomonas guguanensis TaxID=1198456 RepID=UPI0028542BA4|nr:CHC2 zinc finger domain-containing protein [Pseudomonas guguanensis]MDR8016529.1 CHC2 zinc finger domain-containing protein [Pseudomonas guguanensis]